MLRQLLWVLGQHCVSKEEISRVIQEIRLSIGEIPIVDSEQRKEKDGEEESLILDEPVSSGSQSKLTADLTYKTQTALTSATKVLIIKRPFWKCEI